MTDPDLAIDALGKLFGLTPRISELMDRGTQQFGFGYPRMRVLWTLRESGPTLMRAISNTLAITPRTLTSLVDALEADGWLTRNPHPTDRRATLLELTPAAQRLCAGLEKGFHVFASRLFDGVPDRDLRTFVRMLTHIGNHLQDAAETSARHTMPAPPPPRHGNHPPKR